MGKNSKNNSSNPFTVSKKSYMYAYPVYISKNDVTLSDNSTISSQTKYSWINMF